MKQENFAATSVNEYFSWLERSVSQDSALYRAAHAYMESERDQWKQGDESKKTTPFLSIITRTQGKRPDMLTETLLSLTGQTNTDFELLLMGHNLTNEQYETVSEIVSELPQWMRERTRLIPVNGGTRTTPLSAGFDAAQGNYIAILDDDDVVFDHWVETFYEMSKEHRGKILHAYTVIQDWETVGGDFPNTPRAVKAPDKVYCCNFDLLAQLTLNRCPLCALAFPANAYKKLGIRFDETLTTTEDWDFLMRTAFITGVADSSEVTFLYRNWLNAENSASIHNNDEWMDNYRYVVRRFSQTPILLPVGTLQDTYDKMLNQDNDAIYTEDTDQTELFYNDGEGFSQAKKWARKNSTEKERFPYVYSAGKKGAKGIFGIRFDPLQYGAFSLEHLKLRIVCADGNVMDFSMGDITTNGYVFGDTIVFLKNDPQIVLNFSHPLDIKEVQIGCVIKKRLSDDEVDAVISVLNSGNHRSKVRRSLPYRAMRKIYRFVKKPFH